jgi:hypothetical protein
VNENVFAPSLLRNEAKALLTVEKFYSAFACANDLRRHAVETATAASAARATTGRAAAAWAASASKAVSAASLTIAAASAAAAKPVSAAITGGRIAIAATTKRIKTILAETVALVTAAPTSPIVTHNLVYTLSRCQNSKATIQKQRTALSAYGADKKRLHHLSNGYSAQSPALRTILPARLYEQEMCHFRMSRRSCMGLRCGRTVGMHFNMK